MLSSPRAAPLEALRPDSTGDLPRAILDTARHLLVTDGYEHLSMRKIARKIGYSATALYLHFDRKDALVHALIDEGMDRMFERFRSALDGAPPGAPARLRALCHAYVDFGLENPEYYEIMYLLHPERMARYPAEKYRRARRNLDLIEQVLREGTEQGSFRLGDPRVAASVAWATLHGVVSLSNSARIDLRIENATLVDVTIDQIVGHCISPPLPTPIT